VIRRSSARVRAWNAVRTASVPPSSWAAYSCEIASAQGPQSPTSGGGFAPSSRCWTISAALMSAEVVVARAVCVCIGHVFRDSLDKESVFGYNMTVWQMARGTLPLSPPKGPFFQTAELVAPLYKSASSKCMDLLVAGPFALSGARIACTALICLSTFRCVDHTQRKCVHVHTPSHSLPRFLRLVQVPRCPAVRASVAAPIPG